MDLRTSQHKPYRKPNNNPVYVHARSDHPPCIIKNIPIAIGRRITELSSNAEIFDKDKRIYNEALSNSGYEEQIKYGDKKDNRDNRPVNMNTGRPKNKRRKRRRNVTWYNPPYSRSVKTNIGQTFLKLLDKHFPKGSKLNKIFNRNCVKVSYSCMKNVSALIKAHNAKVKRNAKKDPKKKCNCTRKYKGKCPLNGKCLSEATVYRASVKSNTSCRTYIGLAGGTFKERFFNHMKSFTHKKYVNETELSKHIWSLKNKDEAYNISWESLRHSNTFRRDTNICNLCLEEKLEILMSKKSSTSLNRRSELISKCRHSARRKKTRRSNETQRCNAARNDDAELE